MTPKSTTILQIIDNLLLLGLTTLDDRQWLSLLAYLRHLALSDPATRRPAPDHDLPNILAIACTLATGLGDDLPEGFWIHLADLSEDLAALPRNGARALLDPGWADRVLPIKP